MYFVKKRELAENLKNSCFDIAENCEIYNKTEKKMCKKPVLVATLFIYRLGFTGKKS